MAVISYLVAGLSPLVALWIGLAVVGASMFMTPEKGLRIERGSLEMIQALLLNMEAAVESFRVGSSNLYASIGDHVYIYMSTGDLGRAPREPPGSFVSVEEGSVALAFRSPVTRALVEGLGDYCGAVERLAVEALGIADSVACVDEGESAVLEFRRPRMLAPPRLERGGASIYGIIAASVKALERGFSSVVADREEGGVRRVVVRVPSLG